MLFRIVFCFALLSFGYASAASFDCARASTKVEQMICSIPTLSSLDEQLDAQFKQNIKEVRESKGNPPINNRS
ncbi:MAG: hypothetical protein WC426_04605 [Sulfuriferula sp.]